MNNFLLGFILAWVICSVHTHIMIALECKKLGGFFVGKEVFKCVAVKKANDDE